MIIFYFRMLSHPNIVQFFGIHISSTGEQYIVIEYLSKGSLDQLLKTEGNNLEVIDLTCQCNNHIIIVSFHYLCFSGQRMQHQE